MERATENLATNRENWRSLDGYSNYEVSWWGCVVNTKTGRILKGGLSGDGCRTVNLCKNGISKTHKIHQLVSREWVGNPEEKRCVDHIDGNRENNHYENLRYATHTENSRNPKIQTNTSSVCKGVPLDKQSNKWTAHIRINRKLKHLGVFTNEREAAEAYNAAAVEHYEDFARLNIFED